MPASIAPASHPPLRCGTQHWVLSGTPASHGGDGAQIPVGGNPHTYPMVLRSQGTEGSAVQRIPVVTQQKSVELTEEQLPIPEGNDPLIQLVTVPCSAPAMQLVLDGTHDMDPASTTWVIMQQ
jgi:hypothetical protein